MSNEKSTDTGDLDRESDVESADADEEDDEEEEVGSRIAKSGTTCALGIVASHS